ncbi:MAG: hypothetical protein M3462_14185, partial [Chloroflexota bacterium]|nr:hypothetical protein [Chloroflexota bacterium]
ADATDSAEAAVDATATTEQVAGATASAEATANANATANAEQAAGATASAEAESSAAAVATKAACEAGSGGGEVGTATAESSGPPTIAPRGGTTGSRTDDADDDPGDVPTDPSCEDDDDSGEAGSIVSDVETATAETAETETATADPDSDQIATAIPTVATDPATGTPVIVDRDGDDGSPVNGETSTADLPATVEVTATPVRPTTTPAGIVEPTQNPTVTTGQGEPTAVDGTREGPPGESPTETAVPIVPDDPDDVEDIDPTAPADAVVVPGNTPVTDPTPSAAVVVDDGQGGEPSPPSTGVDDAVQAAPLIGLPTGESQGGPLVLSSSQRWFLVGDGRGGPLWVVDRAGRSVQVQVGGAFYPMWEPGGDRFLIAYYPAGAPGPSVGVVDAATGALTPVEVGVAPVEADDAVIIDVDDDVETGDGAADPTAAPVTPTGAVRDVPAGWLGGRPIVQRTYPDDPDRGIELWRSGDAAPFWTAVGQQGRTLHPFQADDAIILAASGGWVAVSASGAEVDLGPETTGGEITDAAIGPAGMIAYVVQGQLVIADLAAPGANPVVIAAGAGVGFDWAPDGSALVVTSGATLAIVSPSGATIATLDVSPAGATRAPAWVTDGVLFIDAATGQLWLLPATALPS